MSTAILWYRRDLRVHDHPGLRTSSGWCPSSCSTTRGVPDEYVHEPWGMSEARQREAGVRLGSGYPHPIVDHGAERRRALERYRRAGGGDG